MSITQTVKTNYRQERIERLLNELRHEVTRGMMEGDLPDEHLGFKFVVPLSKAIPQGVGVCEFRTRPMPRGHYSMDDFQARLSVVK